MRQASCDNPPCDNPGLAAKESAMSGRRCETRSLLGENRSFSVENFLSRLPFFFFDLRATVKLRALRVVTKINSPRIGVDQGCARNQRNDEL